MKNRMFPILLTLIITLAPVFCFSAYLIQLKNGAGFLTNRYWEEGNQIKCSLYGGTTGFDRQMVKSVTETDLRCIIEKKSEFKPPDPEEAGAIDSPLTERQPTVTDKNDAAPIPAIPDFEKERYISKKESIDTEFKSAAMDYRNAKSRLKRAEPANRIDELRQKKAELKTEVIERNEGILPDWWSE